MLNLPKINCCDNCRHYRSLGSIEWCEITLNPESLNNWICFSYVKRNRIRPRVIRAIFSCILMCLGLIIIAFGFGWPGMLFIVAGLLLFIL